MLIVKMNNKPPMAYVLDSVIKPDLDKRGFTVLDIQRGIDFGVLSSKIAETMGYDLTEIGWLPLDEYMVEYCTINHLPHVDVLLKHTTVKRVPSLLRDGAENWSMRLKDRIEADREIKLWIVGFVNHVDMDLVRDIHQQMAGKQKIVFLGDTMIKNQYGDTEMDTFIRSNTRVRLKPSPISCDGINGTFRVLMLFNKIQNTNNTNTLLESMNSGDNSSVNIIESNDFNELLRDDNIDRIITNHLDATDLVNMNKSYREYTYGYEDHRPRIGEILTNYEFLNVKDISTDEEILIVPGSKLIVRTIETDLFVYRLKCLYTRGDAEFLININIDIEAFKSLYDECDDSDINTTTDRVFYGYVTRVDLTQDKLIRRGACVYTHPEAQIDRNILYSMINPITNSLVLLRSDLSLGQGLLIHI